MVYVVHGVGSWNEMVGDGTSARFVRGRKEANVSESQTFAFYPDIVGTKPTCTAHVVGSYNEWEMKARQEDPCGAAKKPMFLQVECSHSIMI